MSTDNDCGCSGCCGDGTDGLTRAMNRREFVQAAGAGSAALAMMASGYPLVAGPFLRDAQSDHFVPADKKLTREWLDTLFAKGESVWHEADDLGTIGMPVGGICAGQLYLTGDGRLACWEIFNQNRNTGYGAVNYLEHRTAEETVEGGKVVAAPEVGQGFAVRVRFGGNTVERTLDRNGFPGVRFCGEYPIGKVRYEDGSLPVTVELEAFSPFIPLDAADSSLPATVLRYTVSNTSRTSVEITLAGWLENAVCHYTGPGYASQLRRRNAALQARGITGVLSTVEQVSVPSEPERPPTVFAGFEGSDYGDWTVAGEAFGTAPAHGTLPDQNPVSGFDGHGLVNTFLGGDGPQGRLRSPEFTIARPYIAFLIGGGAHEGRTCINLLVDGAVVRTATGRNTERLEPRNWDVADLMGRNARIEIVDFDCRHLAQLGRENLARILAHVVAGLFLAQPPFRLDDALEAAFGIAQVIAERAARQFEPVGMAQRGGIFGDTRLVVIGAENELDDRSHRGAFLHRQAGIGQQFVEVLGLVRGGERKVVGPADRFIEGVAGAVLAGPGSGGQFACRSEPIAQTHVFRLELGKLDFVVGAIGLFGLVGG